MDSATMSKALQWVENVTTWMSDISKNIIHLTARMDNYDCIVILLIICIGFLIINSFMLTRLIRQLMEDSDGSNENLH